MSSRRSQQVADEVPLCAVRFRTLTSSKFWAGGKITVRHLFQLTPTLRSY